MLYTPTGYTLDLVVLERSRSSVLEDGLSSYLPSGRWNAPVVCVLLSVIAWRLAPRGARPLALTPFSFPSTFFLQGPWPSSKSFGTLASPRTPLPFLTFRPIKRQVKPINLAYKQVSLQSLCEPLHTVITQCHIQGYTYHKVTSQQERAL